MCPPPINKILYVALPDITVISGRAIYIQDFFNILYIVYCPSVVAVGLQVR